MDRWHIAQLEPQKAQLKRQEDQTWVSSVACLLRARGYDVYYPAFPTKVQKGHGSIRITMRPMFPGYMFVQQNPRGWESLRTTPGVRTHNSLLIDSATGRLAILPEKEIERIAEKANQLMNEAINPPPRRLPYSVGDRVRVTGGAFEGRYATIETLDDEERIALLMDIFGRKSRVYASHEHLSAQ